MKNKLLWALLLIVSPILHFAQNTFPVNGVNNPQVTRYTFINANIYVSADNYVEGGTLEIEDGKIKAVKRKGEKYDTTAIVIDIKHRFIYPSFIDVYSNYGMPAISEKKHGRGDGNPPQYETNVKGAFGWNEAIKPETNAAQLFKHNAKEAEELRKLGFGAVVAFVPDGVSRGTSALVSLADEKENKTLLAKETGANFSFKKGSSTQVCPTSLMGSVALVRQTLYDALAYQKGFFAETNLSLEALNAQLKHPLFFEANNRWDIARIQKIGKEFGYNFIIKTNGDEYQIIDVLKKTPANLVVPISFPAPADVKTFFDEAGLRYIDLKHRHLAPWNAYQLQQNNIQFAFTLSGLKDKKDFLKNIAEAIECGLDEKTALNALTTIPAKYIKADDKLGTLDKGKIANFIITTGKLFDKENTLLENWVQGNRYTVSALMPDDGIGFFDLFINGAPLATITISTKNNKPEIKPRDSSNKISKVNYNIESEIISFIIKIDKSTYHLSGWLANSTYKGQGNDENGTQVNWATIPAKSVDTTTKSKPKPTKAFPQYSTGLPYQYADKTNNTFLIRNVTVWTNEKEGILPNTNVLVKNGKVVAVGDVDLKKFGINDSKDILIINGTGKHLTAGIIDEHSHIGIMGGVNEGSQSSTAEVRIEDVLNPEDINIYRQLAGGVTTSQLLHGSANAIGGQSAVIKLKWGQMADSLLFAGAPGRIKFALGENVKQSNWGERVTERFPQTRMGVEQVFEDAFTRAEEYEKAWVDYKSGKTKKEPRKDIELEALLEVVRGKRLVTCHSYNQQEINMLMKVAEKHGFNINIFTHVLEGYKIADKIKEHGAGASTFSDWWGYKFEVIEATPYNASLLNETGVITCINSDDAEMGRRLNQEAAKAIKYGGMSEEDALKMVTLNPAKLMKIDNRVGSVKAGKDADLVLWSGHPLSIYSKPIKTFIEGVAYFDAVEHKKAEEQLRKEKQALIEAMNKAVAEGKSAEKAKSDDEHLYHCDDIEVYGQEDGK
jgi:imidazolonepropionase-like amidohydrolase